MKLLKKLLPVATIASTIAVTAPILTSCGGVAATSNYDYKPDGKHAAKEISLTDAASIKALTEDYFKDNKRFAQDKVYAKAQNYKEAKAQLEAKAKNVKFNFSIKVTNLKIKEQKTVTLLNREVPGYLIDYEFEYSRSYSYTLNDVEIGGIKYKEYKYTESSYEKDTLKNVFAYIGTTLIDTKLKPTVYVGAYDKVSEDWSWQDHETSDVRVDWTYTDGTTITDKATAEANDYYSKKAGTAATEIISEDIFKEEENIPVPVANIYVSTNPGSYYLSDITVKAA